MRNAFHLSVAVIASLAIVACSDEERTIVRTAVPTATELVEPTETPPASPDPTGVASPTGTLAPTGTAAPTSTAGTTPQPTLSGVPTATPTMTPTGTPAGTAAGPVISYLGLSRADDRVVESIGTDGAGRPIFVREIGTGLSVIIEAQPGLDGRPVGREAFETVGLPDLQILLSRPLGDGSTAVCDVNIDGHSGGVPATDPPVFSDDPATVDAINDLGCRVNDGTGLPVARVGSAQACTRFESGEFSFVEPRSQVQFCLPIARAWAFPKGDTIVTARTRSALGEVGNPEQIVVRILRELTPLPTVPVGTPVRTPTPVPPQITYLGIAAADDAMVPATAVDADGRLVFSRLIGHAFSLVVEAAPSGGGRPVGSNAFSPDGFLPDLQMLVSRDLGDGAPEVCDVDIDNDIFGGVPGTDPLDFDGSELVTAAVNDLGCRVNDGTGAPIGRTVQSPCTRDAFGNFSFVNERSTIQFCLPIAKAWQYQPGDTVTAARVRGIDGGLSQTEEIVIRVAGDGREDCEADGPGVRVFSVDDDRSSLKVAAPGLDSDLSSGWVGSDAFLCASPDENGVHPLRLLRDFTVGLRISDGSVLCAQFQAEGSDGVLDCAGTEPHGVRHEIDSADDSVVLESGLGDPGRVGAASLNLPVAFLSLPDSAAPEDCLDRRFGEAEILALTTEMAEAEVLNPVQGGTAAIVELGEPFDCDRWRTEDSEGRFLMPIASTVDTGIGDPASIFELGD